MLILLLSNINLQTINLERICVICVCMFVFVFVYGWVGGCVCEDDLLPKLMFVVDFSIGCS